MFDRSPKPKVRSSLARPSPQRPGSQTLDNAASDAAAPRFSLSELSILPPDGDPPLARQPQARPRPNRTGLPDRLKAGIEALSGVAMDHVRVHYRSPEPARLGALAYARGREIHVGPGQERHLPHEAWHVVQQAQRRVSPRFRIGTVPVNDDQTLEREASVMGQRAHSETPARTLPLRPYRPSAMLNSSENFLSNPSAHHAVQPMRTWNRRLRTAAGALGGAVAGGLVGAMLGPALLMGAGALAGGYAARNLFTHEPAEDRIERWRERGEARKDRGRFPTGRYEHASGDLTISGLHNQRISQTQKADYDNETMGSMPPYTKVKAELPGAQSVRAIYDPHFEPDGSESKRERMATALSSALSNVSEEDKAPGVSKFIRAMARAHVADPRTFPHPLDSTVNPAVQQGGAARARDMMRDPTQAHRLAKRAIDEGYASDSSDEEDESWPTRTGMLRRKPS